MARGTGGRLDPRARPGQHRGVPPVLAGHHARFRRVRPPDHLRTDSGHRREGARGPGIRQRTRDDAQGADHGGSRPRQATHRGRQGPPLTQARVGHRPRGHHHLAPHGLGPNLPLRPHLALPGQVHGHAARHVAGQRAVRVQGDVVRDQDDGAKEHQGQDPDPRRVRLFGNTRGDETLFRLTRIHAHVRSGG